MNDYNKKREFGGRPSFGGGDRGGFQKRPLELFQATCAACGKTCEVPFRPNGKKPVFCKECFAKNGGPVGDSRPRRDFSRPSPSSYQPEHRPEGDRGMGELARQIESMNQKLDKLGLPPDAKRLCRERNRRRAEEKIPIEKEEVAL